MLPQDHTRRQRRPAKRRRVSDRRASNRRPRHPAANPPVAAVTGQPVAAGRDGRGCRPSTPRRKRRQRCVADDGKREQLRRSVDLHPRNLAADSARTPATGRRRAGRRMVRPGPRDQTPRVPAGPPERTRPRFVQRVAKAFQTAGERRFAAAAAEPAGVGLVAARRGGLRRSYQCPRGGRNGSGPRHAAGQSAGPARAAGGAQREDRSVRRRVVERRRR